MYLKAIKAKAEQERKEQQEHIQQVTHQNAMLVTMVQEQQKKIEELMSTSKTLLDKMTRVESKDNQSIKRNDWTGCQGKKKEWYKKCKSLVYHNSDACHTVDKNKHNHPSWYINRKQGGTQEWWDGGSKHTYNSDIKANN